MSLIRSRTEGLKVYRKILKCHKLLPEEMMKLGNAYVREEFKKHHYPKIEKFTAAHYLTFLTSWKDYLLQMANPETRLYGRNLTSEEVNAMSKEQKETINKYKTNKIIK
ncbi:unnamed protein product [Blepharisma stoltei]|uniref:Succinate dehydrogenase assembly factor 3 n=1 Tax=Blepharisma stoltei TaxID=1481888 RepID=A0AAU9IYB5_9CILI|nr:unnamed protein product [Blepharisma stoltei]